MFFFRLNSPISWKSRSAQHILLGGICLSSMALLSSGCSETLVYKRAISDLNQKAQALLQQDDAQGAVCRLVSARDLDPQEPITLRNLAVAFHANQQWDPSIETFKALLSMEEVPDKAKLYQSLGVVYEEKADALMDEVAVLEEEKKKESPSGVSLRTMTMDAISSYELAIDSYQQVIQLVPAEEERLTEQITFLEKQMKEIQEGAS